MKRYKVVVSAEAKNMMKDHVYFLAKVNVEAAKALRHRFLEGLRSLEKMPERFPYLDSEDRRSGYRKMIIPDWFIVIYLVENDTVYVEYILDGRQDYRWLLHDE